ncbi:hypothetical protein DM01DRAFT_1154916 [Hesseltinella vesiculosa]|uniref:Uncharacterized protein n=1 Tax=Hesseltinella vesiculosa TaxID=101127 RepID=A0A1X2G649_9FUNG|nr:hypothetical protein DM01DRAFT_1154916 [Hesseltinella vesiculosa]
MFSGVMRSDGVQLHIVFSRLHHGPDMPVIATPDLANEDVNGFTLSGVDPGRRAVVTVSYGRGNDPHGIRSMSSKEYRTASREIHEQHHLEHRKSLPLPPAPGPPLPYHTMAEIETNTPMAATADPLTIRESIHHKLLCSESALAFYDTSHARSRFELRKGQQRAIAMTANYITTGSKKYNRSCRVKRHTRRNRKQRKRKAQRRRQVRQSRLKAEYDDIVQCIERLSAARDQQAYHMDQLLRVSLDDPMSLQPRSRSVTQRQAFAVSLNEALDMHVSGHDHATTTLTTEIEELEEQKQAIQRQYLTSSGQR